MEEMFMNNTTLRALEILELIAKSNKPLGITDISRSLDIPKSSVFDIVHTLCKKRFIEPHTGNSKLFVIGIKAYQTGIAYINKINLYNIAHPILERVKDVLGETVYLAVENDGNIVYLDKVESESPILYTCKMGATNTMHVTGLGKALLACYPEEKVREITKGKFEKRTENTIVDIETLLHELEKIRRLGYAIDNGEDNLLVRCVAVPVRDHLGKPAAAISVSMLESSFNEKKEQTIAEISKAGKEISWSLGFTGKELF
jgi:DNA-binding IclR family transcriptional regulator